VFFVKDFRRTRDYTLVTFTNQMIPKVATNRMKRPNLLRQFILLTLLLGPISVSHGQAVWQTVDALTPWRGRAITADNAGKFISLAIDDSTSNSGPVSTAVSLSTDSGATWQTVGLIPGYALKLTAAPDGTLYASGNRSATVSGKAFVWFSVDHGATWAVSDPWSGQPAALISEDITAGNSGSIYLCGWVSGTYNGGRWIVRKGQPSSSGIAWTTADSYTGTQPNAIAVSPGPSSMPDQIFVCGLASTGNWTVRRSLDAGVTWTIVQASSSGTAYSVVIGANGDVYVDGTSTTNIITATNVTTTIVHHQQVLTTNYVTTTFSGWLVQKSTNSGLTWSSVDFATNARPAYARSLAVDAFGRVFAVGTQTTTPNTWFVRGSADAGATWITTDTLIPSGYTTAQAFGVACDALGNVCVVGDVENGTPSADLAPIRWLGAP
jgi:hypothetical protein